MHHYGVREETHSSSPQHYPRIYRSRVRHPVRGPRSAWLFSFQDLIVLRREAQRQPTSHRSALHGQSKRFAATYPTPCRCWGDILGRRSRCRREGANRWQAESGHTGVREQSGRRLFECNRAEAMQPSGDAQRGHDEAVALEEDAEAAIRVYRRAVAATIRCSIRISIWAGACTGRDGLPRPSRRIGCNRRVRRRPADVQLRCSAARRRAQHRSVEHTSPRYAAIPISRTATITVRCYTRTSDSPRLPFGTWLGIAS
jgi:hypothetical protein